MADYVPGTPDWAKPQIDAAAQRWGVSTMLLSSLLKQESGFNPLVTSPSGAQGIAQFMPGTARSYGVDPWNTSSAIDGAAHYLSDMYQRFGDWKLAAAAYNAGPDAVTKAQGIPPFQETQDYIAAIWAHLQGVDLAKATVHAKAVADPWTGFSTAIQQSTSDALGMAARWLWLLLAALLVAVGLLLLVAQDLVGWLEERGDQLEGAAA